MGITKFVSLNYSKQLFSNYLALVNLIRGYLTRSGNYLETHFFHFVEIKHYFRVVVDFYVTGMIHQNSTNLEIFDPYSLILDQLTYLELTKNPE